MKFSDFFKISIFSLEIKGALRVHPAETRLTVYRRLSVRTTAKKDEKITKNVEKLKLIKMIQNYQNAAHMIIE